MRRTPGGGRVAVAAAAEPPLLERGAAAEAEDQDQERDSIYAWTYYRYAVHHDGDSRARAA